MRLEGFRVGGPKRSRWMRRSVHEKLVDGMLERISRLVDELIAADDQTIGKLRAEVELYRRQLASARQDYRRLDARYAAAMKRLREVEDRVSA